jgi:hypothetical protein
MKLFIFVVRDRATDQFGTPMFLVSSGQAIRSFSDEVNRAAQDNMMYQHPDDFDLYSLGSFDTNAGVFETSVPEQVAIGKMVKVRS